MVNIMEHLSVVERPDLYKYGYMVQSIPSTFNQHMMFICPCLEFAHCQLGEN